MAKSFSIEVINDEVKVDFQSRADLRAIRQLEFSSRLLHGLVPDESNVWRPGKRSDFHIAGFPPNIYWRCVSQNVLVGTPLNGFILDSNYLDGLSQAIEGLCAEASDEGVKYSFKISDGAKFVDYEFYSRARTICALAVLYDLGWHPRKDLEIWINPDYTDKLPPGETPDHSRPEEQYYGDPSKTADVLRNEGWAREASEPYMFVEARQVGRQSQQHYRITQREQPLGNQVKRTNIKAQWRNSLFQMQEHTCKICLANYEANPEQLSPDHRIPVVFEPDNLTDENYSYKLMTLCRYCNQAKREFTKRLGFDYDWQSSPWAFPEKFRMEIAINQLKAVCQESGYDTQEVIAELNLRLGENGK